MLRWLSNTTILSRELYAQEVFKPSIVSIVGRKWRSCLFRELKCSNDFRTQQFYLASFMLKRFSNRQLYWSLAENDVHISIYNYKLYVWGTMCPHFYVLGIVCTSRIQIFKPLIVKWSSAERYFLFHNFSKFNLRSAV